MKNKEIDVKGAAELLGVSYGTLYGRYRELFGYVKHAWNLAGRPMKLFPMSNHIGFLSGNFTKEPSAAIWTDPSNQEVLEQLKNGHITIRQAAELLGIEPALLAYQLSGKVFKNIGTRQFNCANFHINCHANCNAIFLFIGTCR